MDDTKTPRTYLTDGTSIAAITAYSFYLSFLYEAGYCRYFGIPETLVTISNTTLLLSGSKVIIVLIVVYLLYDLLPTWFSSLASNAYKEGNQWDKGKILAGLLIFALGMSMLYGFKTFLISIATLLTISLFVTAWFYIHKCITGRIPPAPQPDKIAKDIVENKASNLTLFIRNNLSYIFILLSVLPSAVGMQGFMNAREQTDFLFIVDEGNFAMVRNYGDLFIAVEIDPHTKKLGENIKVISASDAKNLTLMKRKISEESTAPINWFKSLI